MNLAAVNYIERRPGETLPKAYVDAFTNCPKELLCTDLKDYGFLDDPKVMRGRILISGK